MDINLCTNKVLQIINRYSIKGTLVDAIKNKDNTLRINNLIDTVQKECATYRKLMTYETYYLDVPDEEDEDYTLSPASKPYAIFVLPDDYRDIENLWVNNNVVTDYIIQGFNLLLNNGYVGEAIMEYSRTPITITDLSPVTTLLEGDFDVQELYPYYIAGHLLLPSAETNGLGTQLISEYEDKRDKLKPRNKVVGSVEIENVFGGF
jgi:hypothetical protein